MKQKRGLTTPYRNKEDVKKAIDYLRKNCDKTYVLIFKVMVSTGLRVSDVLNLRWDDNYVNGRIRLNESKGTKMELARLKSKVLKKAKETLLAVTTDAEEIKKILLTHHQDIYDLLPESLQKIFDEDLKKAESLARPKFRECILPSPLVRHLVDWKRDNKGKDGGYMFPANLVKYSKAKNPKPLSRQTVWRVFHNIGIKCGFDFNTSCHQLRKTFAVFLYEATGNDNQLVIEEVGWEDDRYLKRYLAIEKDKCNKAVAKMQEDYLR